MTREVGVGSAYAGLQRARERGNVCVCLCCREIGKEFVSLSVGVCISVFVYWYMYARHSRPLRQGLYYISEELCYEWSIIWLTYVSLHTDL